MSGSTLYGNQYYALSSDRRRMTADSRSHPNGIPHCLPEMFKRPGRLAHPYIARMTRTSRSRERNLRTRCSSQQTPAPGVSAVKRIARPWQTNRAAERHTVQATELKSQSSSTSIPDCAYLTSIFVPDIRRSAATTQAHQYSRRTSTGLGESRQGT